MATKHLPRRRIERAPPTRSAVDCAALAICRALYHDVCTCDDNGNGPCDAMKHAASMAAEQFRKHPQS